MNDTKDGVRLGVVKPKLNPQSNDDLVALLPADIEMIPEYIGFAYGSLYEFRNAMPIYEEKVAALAAQNCDLIHPEGAPPFMMQGYAAECAYIKKWEAAYRVPIFTTGSTQVAAMRALGITRFVGYTPFAGELAEAFARYFTDAGFDVISMGKPIADDEDVYQLTTEQIRDRIIEKFASEPAGAEALYILGSDWRALDVMLDVETAIGVPVLHPVVVRCWYILTELGRRQPFTGKGQLLAQMPPFATPE
jgi:maleate cis-trans isomerase